MSTVKMTKVKLSPKKIGLSENNKTAIHKLGKSLLKKISSLKNQKTSFLHNPQARNESLMHKNLKFQSRVSFFFFCCCSFATHIKWHQH